MGIAVECLKIAFYPESTLEALQLLEEEPGQTPQDAAKRVVAQKEKMTRRLFAAQGSTRQLLRESKAAVGQLAPKLDGTDEQGERAGRCIELVAKIEELATRMMAAQATKEQVEAVESAQQAAAQIHSELKTILNGCSL